MESSHRWREWRSTTTLSARKQLCSSPQISLLEDLVSKSLTPILLLISACQMSSVIIIRDHKIKLAKLSQDTFPLMWMMFLSIFRIRTAGPFYHWQKSKIPVVVFKIVFHAKILITVLGKPPKCLLGNLKCATIAENWADMEKKKVIEIRSENNNCANYDRLKSQCKMVASDLSANLYLLYLTLCVFVCL